jgi:hypothetical protein
MRTRLALLLLLPLALAGARSARADVVVMKDGRQLQGRSSVEGDEVVIRQKHGEVRVLRADVLRIDHEDDVYSQYARKEAALQNGTADERYELGCWARDHKLDDEARAAFLSVLKVDPDHPGARAALGYVLEDGHWITEDDQMASRGLVKFQGRWMTPADKIKAEAELADKLAKAKEAAKKAEDDRQAARLAKLEADRQARLARIRAYEEERARARADEAQDTTAVGVLGLPAGLGPYGFYGGYYGYGGINTGGLALSNTDMLIYAGYLNHRGTRGLVAPNIGAVLTTDAALFGGAVVTTPRSVPYSLNLNNELGGSWTSRSGSQGRSRTGF